jgi:hypothetical protein
MECYSGDDDFEDTFMNMDSDMVSCSTEIDKVLLCYVGWLGII